MPLSTIEGILRIVARNYVSTIDRIKSLQPDLKSGQCDQEWPGSYKRQCPECAKELYHTDIFALPWLTLCPIHHCNLVSICPVCKMPWPNYKDLDKRVCTYCGRPPLDSLGCTYCVDGLSEKYEPIKDLFNFIESGGTHSLDYDIDGGEMWSQEVSVGSAAFPAAHLYSQPNYSIIQLETLHVSLDPVLYKTSKLVKCGSKPIYRNVMPDEDCDYYYNLKLESDYSIITMILSWIANHTGNEHLVHISSYRNINLKNIVDGPTICPYCMAVSLWFFHITALRYGRYFINTVDNYPFCNEAGYNLLNVDIPYIRKTFDDYYVLDRNFSTWFYRRGLIVLFIDILKFTIDLYRYRIPYLRKIRQYHHYTPLTYSYDRQSCSDREFYSEIIHDVYHFFYKSEHPLNHLDLPINDFSKTRCRKYHKYLNYHISHMDRFNYTLNVKDFCYDSFIELQETFKKYMTHSLYIYSRGSSSFH
ncbi:MAG: hypothetical protein N0C84_22850 [Candidatus Thiodiazotropha taylori]|uniref:Uncharacterized protein n=1 Tax=Candidatus Thiodiazotropha taylori TaxID=2792791 RepID=A0A9E4N7V8_9GAMM|nr:hypothetical protein [Candidatus Thiodiazotropha taylori]MBV2124642.1 hypothetical protein [Candidatus Thiodiazotropha taylori]MCG7949182.1 hypothetical protein [Candidatus Thiodiazotropha taylori]MCW4259309.1 hypothetical protein [Candidatus Thiodiazotropha taylori]